MEHILLYSILIPIIAAVMMNGIIYTFGLNKQYDKNIINPYIPPGYVIGTIWVVILGLLGYSHYLLYKLNNRISFTSLFLIFVILFCISYPLITWLKQKSESLLNLITLILAFILGILVIIESKYIFIYIIPLIAWTTYINIVYAYYNAISP
jgi:tryptophan-rich sensory protein